MDTERRYDEQPNPPRRRDGDHSRWARIRAHGGRWEIHARENWYRDLFLLILAGMWVVLAINLHTTDQRVISGRRVAIGLSCGTTSAIAQAGYAQLRYGGQLPKGFAQFLEAHGYPSADKRAIAAHHAADAYRAAIVRAVVSQIGARGAHLIRPDGTLDCRKVRQLSNAT